MLKKDREVLLEALMLSAEIEMQGMIAENKYLEQINSPIHYRKEHFDQVIKKYSILNLSKYTGSSENKIIQFIQDITKTFEVQPC